MEQEQSLESIKAGLKNMQSECPELVRNFGALFAFATKNGAVSAKHKELICLGIALAQRCESCIAMHVEKCAAALCSREEMLEAAGVAVLMQGGPAYMHIPFLIKIMDALGIS